MVRSIPCTLVTIICLGGCTVQTPEMWRQRCKHTYTVEVACDYQILHSALVARMYTVGWGEMADVRQILDTERRWGTIAAHYPDVREPIGFIIDVEAIGDTRAKVTVYPESRWYGHKVQAWIDDLTPAGTP